MASASHLLSQDVLPIGAGYLILMAVLAAGLLLVRRDAIKARRAAKASDDQATRQEAARSAGAKAAPAAGVGTAVDTGQKPDARAAEKPATAVTDAVEPGSGGKRPGLIARQFRPGWPRFCAQIFSVALGGYVLLMIVDIIYYYGVAKVAGQFIDSAVSGGALLIGITLPLFAAASWVEVRWRNRSR